MIKTIIKETFIMLLLCVAIVLILGILFYNYIPTNRVIPTKEAYTTPNDVKTEINEQITEIFTNAEKVYEITDADLNLYKKTSNYKPGKRDPFSVAVENPTNDVVTNNIGNTGKNDITTNTDSNSTGTFFNSTGLK